MKRAEVLIRKIAGIIGTLVSVCFFLAVLYVVLQVFVYGSFTIPTESMTPAIIPGDKVIVEKVSTGARLFDFRKTHRGEKTKIIRTPHWNNFKRGDILVFNFVHRDSWDTISMNWSRYYIKRCLAIPGDTLEIRNFIYYVNGVLVAPTVSPKLMESMFPTDSTARSMNMRGYMTDRSDSIDRWNIRDLGPWLVPGKGMKLKIDTLSYRRYRQIIEWETLKQLCVKEDRIVLGGDPIDEYEFQQNYYFMAGDNYLNSQDSRYWGLLPEDFIVGRARFIWWSEKNGRIRWNRIMKSL